MKYIPLLVFCLIFISPFLAFGSLSYSPILLRIVSFDYPRSDSVLLASNLGVQNVKTTNEYVVIIEKER